ncbi:MAG TPA: phenylalanine--tRNA ligase subunit alpha [Candidatus Nanoarchaeia archaeon]|nr:phenylalanine--tRNA ligase subunit alpha [Candidatus Nanoarchaeia archaeon]
MDIKAIINSLSPLERRIIPFLKENITLQSLIDSSKLQEVEVIRALQWLENKKAVRILIDHKSLIKLDKNGLAYLNEDLPERKLLNILNKQSTSLEILKKNSNLNTEELNVAIGYLKSKNAIEFTNKQLRITNQGKEILSTKSPEQILLQKLSSQQYFLDTISKEEKLVLESLKKRKDFIKIDPVKLRTVTLTDLGKELITKFSNIKDVYIENLTSEVITKKSYIGKKFRHYDIETNVPRIYSGRRHFVNEAIDYIKRIWLDLGFKEMQGNYIDTSFWNFDTLFVPQNHPARDMQDTLFVSGKGNVELNETTKRVKETHENGWTTKSKGWQYKWNIEDAKKLVLRTHTTVLSSKTIANLKKENLPTKYFSVGKVFRNETLDKTHLFEFYQTEGIVIDENANFKQLMGYLKTFFEKMGFEKIRIRPGYFPYTEPSIEVDVYHPIHKKWIELGGAGIFRPEVVKPLLGIDVPVLAWGLGVERIITDYYDINDLRDLYSNDLKKLRGMKIWIK